MEYPKLSEYIDCKSYFQDFYKINKDTGGPASYRFLAKKLDWPISYLNDLIHGRRNLTISRALEFAKFANFDVVNSERLIYMSLKDSNVKEIQEHFSAKLDKECKQDRYVGLETPFYGLDDDYPTSNDEIKNDLAASALLKLFVWSQGSIKKDLIPKLLYTFDELKDLKNIDEKLVKLERNGNIKLLSSVDESQVEVEILKPTIHFALNKENISQFSVFSENTVRILHSPSVAGFFNAGFVNIRKNRLLEVRSKIGMFRNWLLEIEKEASEDFTQDSYHCLLFQYDLNISCLFDYKVLGIESLKDWEKSGDEPIC